MMILILNKIGDSDGINLRLKLWPYYPIILLRVAGFNIFFSSYSFRRIAEFNIFVCKLADFKSTDKKLKVIFGFW